MPKLAKFAYTRQTNILGRILLEASTKPRPRKIDRTWLLSGYEVHSNYDTIPSVLKFVKLLNRDSTPTDAWQLIQDPTPENRIRFAKLIREAYAALFDHETKAHRLNDEELRKFFRGQEVGGPIVVQSNVSTFKTLVRFGDFDTDPGMITLPELMHSVKKLDENIHAWLKSHNELESRMQSLDTFHGRLDRLSLQTNKYFTDAIAAAESELFHASHVLAWIGFTEFFYQPFTGHNIITQDPKFQPKTFEELRRESDHNIIEHGKKLGFYSEGTKKTLQGMVNDRNRCAHGSGYDPNLNETISFLKKIFDMIEFLRANHGNLWP